MYRSFLSWRYLRARFTNWIGVAGIFVGVGALILILSIMSGFLEETKKTVRGSLADIIIQPFLLAPGTTPPEKVRTPDAMLDVVRQDPRVLGAAAQLTWFGMVAPRGQDAVLTKYTFQQADRAGVQLVGVDPQDEFQTTEFLRSLEREGLGPGDSRVEDPQDPFAVPSGYRPSGRPLEGAVIVGEQLFRRLFLRRGQEVNVMTGAPDPDTGEFVFSNRHYVVAGTFRSGENEMDLDRVYLQRSELADLLSAGETYSQVLVKLEDYERDGLATQEELRSKLRAEGLLPRSGIGQVSTWEDYRQTLLGAIENEKKLMRIMLGLVMLVAGFTIFAILSMMVTEKRRDIGILSALGSTRGGIMAVFVMIGFWDWLIGSSLGAFFGTWAAIEIDAIEQWLSRTFNYEFFDRDVYLFDRIPSVVSFWGVLWIVVFAFACTIVAAALAAAKAALQHPIDALRYE